MSAAAHCATSPTCPTQCRRYVSATRSAQSVARHNASPQGRTHQPLAHRNVGGLTRRHQPHLLNASRRPPSFPFASAHMHRQPISHDKTVSPLPNTLTNTWAAGTAPLGRVKIPPPTEHEQALPRLEEEQEDGGPASGERTPPLRTSRESMVPYNGPCHEPSNSRRLLANESQTKQPSLLLATFPTPRPSGSSPTTRSRGCNPTSQLAANGKAAGPRARQQRVPSQATLYGYLPRSSLPAQAEAARRQILPSELTVQRAGATRATQTRAVKGRRVPEPAPRRVQPAIDIARCTTLPPRTRRLMSLSERRGTD